MSWIPWPHVHAEDIVLGNPPDIPQSDDGTSAARGSDAGYAGATEQNGLLPWIKLEQPDVRLIRLTETANNWTFKLASDPASEKPTRHRPGLSALIIFSSIAATSALTIR